jgi:hypothetical protein
MALLFGIHENQAPADTAARTGGTTTRAFTNGVIAPKDLIKVIINACAPAWQADQTAVWSFKPDPRFVRSGQWRGPIEALGRWLKAHPQNKTVVVIWHEPENDVPEYFADADAFVRMFNTVAGWLRGVHPQVTICHAALGYRYADKVPGGITDATAGRWRTTADLHCIDIYSGRSNPLGKILPELSGFRRWRQYVAPYTWGVTERGFAAATRDRAASDERVATIAREADWLVGNLPVMYLLWNTEGTEGDPKLVFDAPAERAATALLARLATAGAGTGRAGGAPPAAPAPAPVAAPAGQVRCPSCGNRFVPVVEH